MEKLFSFSCVFEGLDTIGDIEHVTTDEIINIDLLELFIMNHYNNLYFHLWVEAHNKGIP